VTTTLEGPNSGRYRWTLVFEADRVEDDSLTHAVQFHAAQVAAQGGGRMQVWVHEATEGDDSALAGAGFEPYRDLLQLRCALPAAETDLPVRGFAVTDAEAFLEVNNAAFDWHPEQNNMTRSQFDVSMSETWFDPAGFLLHHRDQRLAGFCWTKLHEDSTPRFGEIYVIAVHPDFAGEGLGTKLTLAGLTHLHSVGAEMGMLYVESDNDAANTVYERIGFRRHHVNRAYEALIEDGS
jgi:mycothiol synthase